jgi:hypothetical protein
MINEYRVDQMNDDQIRKYYDRHLNLTLAQLAQLTGKTIQQLKTILLK